MKVYLCVTVGQEIDGRNVVVRIDSASANKTKVDEFLNTNKNSWVEKFQVPEGMVDMYFQRNAQEIEVSDV